MIRALWYLLKVGLLAFAVVWLSERPGSVHIEWLDYTFKVHLGLFLVALLVIMVLAIFAYRILRAVTDAPKQYKNYVAISRKEKGHRALALGLTAVAAGDARTASVQAERALKLLPHDRGMPLLLSAQAARLKGNDTDARKIFAAMMENKDTAFLGVRGLLQGALEAQNYTHALALARQGLKLFPKQPWMLRMVYDLELRARNWDEAWKILARAEKAGAVSADAARSDRVAILLAEADGFAAQGHSDEAAGKITKAFRADPYFVPTVLRQAELYKQKGQTGRAARLIERTWAKVQHPDLAAAWLELVPAQKNMDALERLKRMEKLAGRAPNSPESHLAVAQAAMEASLWGEARDHLHKAEEQCADARIYRMLAEVENRSGNDRAGEEFMEQADKTPQGKTWVCRETGRVYTRWSPVAEPHGSFNTIAWDFPHAGRADILAPRMGGDVLIEARS